MGRAADFASAEAEWVADSICWGEREEIQSYLTEQQLSRKPTENNNNNNRQAKQEVRFE